jgi:hypothetical protein
MPCVRCAESVLPVVALFLALSCAVPGTVHGQSATATVSGSVLDESGAFVPDVQITVINLRTGLERTTRSASRGSFVMPLLPPGTYRLTARRDGFTPAEIPQLVLNVGDAVDLRLVLMVARVDASVTVTAGPARVSTLPSVGTVVDRQFVENLPLNGRSVQSLITMTPGVVLTPTNSTSPGQFSVNGQRSDANYFMVDGVSANVGVQSGTALGVGGVGAVPGISAQGGTNSLVSVDALQEFKIETSTYAPEFGRTPGGQISIVTRSGTNQYHGTLSAYFRDDALDSADYFVKRQHLAKPKQHQTDFGGVFGGPLQRERTFFFVSYEGLRLDQPRSAVTEVPSQASRVAASTVLRPYFDAFPVANGPETARGLAQFSASYSDPSTLNAISVRVDRTFAVGLNTFARYNYAPSDASSRLGSFAILSLNSVGVLQNSLQTLTTGATWIATPTISNDLRVNWSRNLGKNFQYLDTFGGAVVLPAATLHPPFAPTPNGFQWNLSGTNASIGEGSNAANVQRQINLVDALLIAKARHQIKLGFDYRRFFPIYNPTKYSQNNVFAGAAGALAGSATSVSINASSSSNRYPHATNLSAYAQDTWALGSQLTLAYGIRWEMNPPPGLKDTPDAVTLTTSDPTAMTVAAPGTPMYRTTYNNIAPRVGASYRLNDDPGRELVLRAGWGIFFDLGNTASIENLSNSYPFIARRPLTNPAFPVDPVLLAPPTITPGGMVDFVAAADPNLKLPYTHQWDVAVERALGAANTASVSYVGALGRRLLRQERLQNPNPRFGTVTLGTNHGHSEYHALQVKFTRRLSGGLQALATYTLATSMDNISSDVIPALPSFRVDPEADWGPSDFDVRHTLGAGVTYAIPTRGSAGVWGAISRDWSVDAILTSHSALPVNVVTGTPAFTISNALRPDLVPSTSLYVDDSTVPGGRRFNRLAFAAPPLDAAGNPLRQGTLGRNALRGFAMSQLDLAVRRDIRLRGALRAQVRVEAFNLFNQVSFGPPTNSLSSGLFGQATRTLATSLGAGGVTGGGLNPLYQVGGPRSLQLAMRLNF